MMCATQINPNQPNHYCTALPVRAREHQIRAPKKCILGGMSRRAYSDNVTVYPYNGHINSTNPIVRHAMSLTCTMKRILVNYGAPKHAKIQLLHGSNTHARAPNLRTSLEITVGTPTWIMLPFIRTTNTLEVQILSYDMSDY